MILTVTLNPSLDRTLFVDGLKLHDTNRTTRVEIDAGGKGLNVSRIVDAMGGETVAIAPLGGAIGRRIEEVLARETVVFRSVLLEEETRMNISIEDGSGKPPTTLNTRGATVNADAWSELKRLCESYAEQTTWVCLCGSLPPGVPTTAYAELLPIFRDKGASVCVDADGPAMEAVMPLQPDLIKPNQSEVGRLLGREVSNLDDALEAAAELNARGIRYGLVSMGALGAALVAEGQSMVALSPEIEPKSTIGSGDSMIGGFLASLYRGDSLVDAFRWGCAAGAATAMSDGSSIGKLKDIESLVEHVRVEHRPS